VLDFPLKKNYLFRFWNKICETHQILNQKVHNASRLELKIFFVLSDSEVKDLQRDSFWIEKLSTCQFLKLFSFEKSDFENGKVFGSQSLNLGFFWIIFEEKYTFKKPWFHEIYSVKTAKVSPFVLSQKPWLWSKSFHLKNIAWKKFAK